jgi:hypothetical protein
VWLLLGVWVYAVAAGDWGAQLRIQTVSPAHMGPIVVARASAATVTTVPVRVCLALDVSMAQAAADLADYPAGATNPGVGHGLFALTPTSALGVRPHVAAHGVVRGTVALLGGVVSAAAATGLQLAATDLVWLTRNATADVGAPLTLCQTLDIQLTLQELVRATTHVRVCVAWAAPVWGVACLALPAAQQTDTTLPLPPLSWPWFPTSVLLTRETGAMERGAPPLRLWLEQFGATHADGATPPEVTLTATQRVCISTERTIHGRRWRATNPNFDVDKWNTTVWSAVRHVAVEQHCEVHPLVLHCTDAQGVPFVGGTWRRRRECTARPDWAAAVPVWDHGALHADWRRLHNATTHNATQADFARRTAARQAERDADALRVAHAAFNASEHTHMQNFTLVARVHTLLDDGARVWVTATDARNGTVHSPACRVVFVDATAATTIATRPTDITLPPTADGRGVHSSAVALRGTPLAILADDLPPVTTLCDATTNETLWTLLGPTAPLRLDWTPPPPAAQAAGETPIGVPLWLAWGRRVNGWADVPVYGLQGVGVHTLPLTTVALQPTVATAALSCWPATLLAQEGACTACTVGVVASTARHFDWRPPRVTLRSAADGVPLGPLIVRHFGVLPRRPGEGAGAGADDAVVLRLTVCVPALGAITARHGRAVVPRVAGGFAWRRTPAVDPVAPTLHVDVCVAHQLCDRTGRGLTVRLPDPAPPIDTTPRRLLQRHPLQAPTALYVTFELSRDVPRVDAESTPPPFTLLEPDPLWLQCEPPCGSVAASLRQTLFPTGRADATLTVSVTALPTQVACACTATMQRMALNRAGVPVAYGLLAAETYALHPRDDFRFEPTVHSTRVALHLTLVPSWPRAVDATEL